MSDEAVIALITTVGSVIVAGIGVLAKIFGNKLEEIKGHTVATKEQVKNSHTTNLRDDIDEFRREVNDRLDNQAKAWGATAREVAQVRQRLNDHIDGGGD